MRSDMEKEAAATFVFRCLGPEAVEKLRGQDDRSPLSWRTVDRWRTTVFEGSKMIMMGSGFEAMKKILLARVSQQGPTRNAKDVLSALQKDILPTPREFD